MNSIKITKSALLSCPHSVALHTYKLRWVTAGLFGKYQFVELQALTGQMAEGYKCSPCRSRSSPIGWTDLPVASLVSSSFSGSWRPLMEEVLVTEAEDPEKPDECVASRLSSIIGLQETKVQLSSGIEHTNFWQNFLNFLSVSPACMKCTSVRAEPTETKRRPDPPELELRGAVSSTGNWTKSKCFQSLRHCFSPQPYAFLIYKFYIEFILQ